LKGVCCCCGAVHFLLACCGPQSFVTVHEKSSMTERVLWKNADGSETLLETNGDDVMYHGGRINHIGSAALAPEAFFTFDPDDSTEFQRKRRQTDSVRDMVDAFRRDAEEPQNVELAALQLEEDFTFARDSDISKLTMNEKALMSTQRWIISSLPFDVVRQCVRVALTYRQATAVYEPLLSKGRGMPNPQRVFSTIAATEETRPDIIALLNTLLEMPAFVDCHVYSEHSKRILTAWRGFEFAPDSPLSNTMSPSEMIYLAQSSTGTINADRMMNPQVCYWCRKTALSCHLKVCNLCKSLVYCGRDCQVNDWKAFHKTECPQLKSGKMKNDLFMASNRMETLSMDGQRRATLPLEIAPADSDIVWRGDLMLLYITHMSPNNALGEKTKGFPTGWFIRPRELTLSARDKI